MIGLKVLVGENLLKKIQVDTFFFSGGVRKHLWRMAYPEKLYFVGELMSMSTFSPKMVTINFLRQYAIEQILRIIWFVFLLVIWHWVGIFIVI